MSKTIPPICPEPETGRQYWRSLDQLAEKPEFRQWLEREFPAGASEWSDPVSRRHFMRIMSASFMLAGLGLAATGCRRPIEKLEPFGKQPDEFYVYGMPQFFATAMPTRDGAVSLLAKSYDGRPIKVEGNVLHPDGNGGTDRYSQASILNLYDPDRAQRFAKNGVAASRDDALGFIDSISKKHSANQGQGLAFLLERTSSPSRLRLQKLAVKKFPKAKWFVHEAINTDIHRTSASAAFGASVKPYYKYDAAKVIVSLDCDFIGAEEDAHNNIRKFVSGRRIEKPTDTMKPAVCGPGVDDPHWHERRPSSATRLQRGATVLPEALKAAVNGQTDFSVPAGVVPKWISECAADLKANSGSSLVVVGQRQPFAVHILAHALNASLGNVGKTVLYQEVEDPAANEGDISDFAKSAAQFETIVIIGAEIRFTMRLPMSTSRKLLRRSKVAQLSVSATTKTKRFRCAIGICRWRITWNRGVTPAPPPMVQLVPVRTCCSHCFVNPKAEIEILARIAGSEKISPYDIVRATFAEISGSEFREFLAQVPLQRLSRKLGLEGRQRPRCFRRVREQWF